jgi:sigma-B regulation protein RsbU (phosphoserine phosphatase)
MRSVRFRLLVAVNAAIALLSGVYMVVDYRGEMAARIAEKHVALDEEAETLLPAVMRIRPHGVAEVQRFVDDVCGRMRDGSSPGHHIAVCLGQIVLQAKAHDRASPAIFQAMEAAAASGTDRAEFGDEELVVGSSGQGDVLVYVSEYVSNIRRDAHRLALRRLGRIVLLVVVTAVVVNLVFLRMAARPIRQLVDTVRQIAAGKLGAQAGPFRSAEFAYLGDAINSMSSALSRTDRRRRLAMAHARRIQESVLPGEMCIPGLTVAHSYRPADQVAGDYYDSARLSDGTYLLCVADVVGHGVPAAMNAMMLKGLLLHAVDRETDPVEILRFLNLRLLGLGEADGLTSMFLARYDPAAATLEYASAGHEKGLLLRATGELRQMPATGLLLAVMEEATWDSERIDLRAGDRILLVTDGVTEAMNPRGEIFGAARLVREFEASRDVPVCEVIPRIHDALDQHCGKHDQDDDITVLVFEVTGGSSPE